MFLADREKFISLHVICIEISVCDGRVSVFTPSARYLNWIYVNPLFGTGLELLILTNKN